MRHRAPPSGVTLNVADAAIVKAMLARGDRQHDVAAWFGVNSGRIAEIVAGRAFASVAPAPMDGPLPPPGPYPSGREAALALEALAKAENAIEAARRMVKARLSS
jgi:hypothetical protein